MNGQHTAGFCTRTLIGYALSLYSDGDVHSVTDMGISEQQIHWLSQLTEAELHEFCKSRLTIFQIHIDTNTFNVRRSELERLRIEKSQQSTLLRFGSPVALMSYLFGLTSEDCAALRRQHGIKSSAGRPENLSESQIQKAWDIWHSNKDKSFIDRFIEIGKAGIALNSAWTMLHQLAENETAQRRRP